MGGDARRRPERRLQPGLRALRAAGRASRRSTAPTRVAILARHSMELVPSLRWCGRRSRTRSRTRSCRRWRRRRPTASRRCRTSPTRWPTSSRRSPCGGPRPAGYRRRAGGHASRHPKHPRSPAGGATALGLSGARLWSAVGASSFCWRRRRPGWLLWGRAGTAAERPAGGLNDHRIAVLYFEDAGGSDSLATWRTA